MHGLDLPSAAVGFAAGLALWLVVALLRRAGGLVFKLVLFGGVAALLGGGYFGWMRSVAGLGDARISSPREIVEDAKRAAAKMNARTRETERVLSQLEDPPPAVRTSSLAKAKTSTRAKVKAAPKKAR